jgi:hypothetical protein
MCRPLAPRGGVFVVIRLRIRPHGPCFGRETGGNLRAGTPWARSLAPRDSHHHAPDHTPVCGTAIHRRESNDRRFGRAGFSSDSSGATAMALPVRHVLPPEHLSSKCGEPGASKDAGLSSRTIAAWSPRTDPCCVTSSASLAIHLKPRY